jgi:hypothetical protein
MAATANAMNGLDALSCRDASTIHRLNDGSTTLNLVADEFMTRPTLRHDVSTSARFQAGHRCDFEAEKQPFPTFELARPRE